MKDKRYKHLEDLLIDYLELKDELKELSLQISKAKNKYGQYEFEQKEDYLTSAESDDIFRIFNQLKKYEDRTNEATMELQEVEGILKDFLSFAEGHKVSLEKKDDGEKKQTYLFWLEEGEIRSNR